MPLKSGKKNIGANIRELKADNKKSGKEKGAEGKERPMRQIIAIALNVAKVPKKEGSKPDMKKDMGKKEMNIEKKEYKVSTKKNK